MTKLKIRGLKWQKLNVRGSVLHFYLKIIIKLIMTSSQFDPGLISVQLQKPWISLFYDSIYSPGLKTLPSTFTQWTRRYNNWGCSHYCAAINKAHLSSILSTRMLFRGESPLNINVIFNLHYFGPYCKFTNKNSL